VAEQKKPSKTKFACFSQEEEERSAEDIFAVHRGNISQSASCHTC